MATFLAENTVVIQLVGTLVLWLLSLWRGGGPERILAGTMFAMVVLDQGYHAMFGFASNLTAVDPWHMALDTVALASMVWVALLSNRFYPLVMAAAQVVAFTAHLVRALVEPISSLSYYLLYAMPFWFQMFLLGAGLVRHAMRQHKQGPYPDWRPGHMPRDGLGYS